MPDHQRTASYGKGFDALALAQRRRACNLESRYCNCRQWWLWEQTAINLEDG